MLRRPLFELLKVATFIANNYPYGATNYLYGVTNYPYGAIGCLMG